MSEIMNASATDESEAIWPIRTFLFVPGNRPEWVPKAVASGPDALILDLEDSVAPSEKQKARAEIARALDGLETERIHVFVKINGLFEGGEEDLRACVCGRLRGIVVPKATAADIYRIHDVLSYCEGRAGTNHGEISIIALPETAEGLRFAYETARASRRVKGLLGGVGPIQGDIAAAVGFCATVEGFEQQYLQSKLVLDSRAAGALYPIAGVFATHVDDLTMIEGMTRRAKIIGFSGVHVIHPAHVSIANSVMRPSPDEIEYAQALLAALEAGHREGRGAVRFRGMMVDRAMVASAKRTIVESKRYRGPPRAEETN
jgi:citrate lyase subunit beta/citryl-CoA lyase